MTKAMPHNPPKNIFGKAIAAWVRQKNLMVLAANQRKRELRRAREGQ